MKQDFGIGPDGIKHLTKGRNVCLSPVWHIYQNKKKQRRKGKTWEILPCLVAPFYVGSCERTYMHMQTVSWYNNFLIYGYQIITFDSLIVQLYLETICYLKYFDVIRESILALDSILTRHKKPCQRFVSKMVWSSKFFHASSGLRSILSCMRIT